MANPENIIAKGVTEYLLNNGYVSPIPDLLTKVDQLATGSNSQLKQDILVLLLLNFKENGYFVEFGATDGYVFSNTFLLEKEFQWDGILVEPAKIWRPLEQLRECSVDYRCVDSISGATVLFHESSTAFLSSTMKTQGTETKTYEVETVSLNDLLIQHNAPVHINYLSVDTKGGEFEILKTLDFNKYSFDIITVDHSFSIDREKVYALLTNKGYHRICNEISWVDDWFVSANYVGTLGHTNNVGFVNSNPPVLTNN